MSKKTLTRKEKVRRSQLQKQLKKVESDGKSAIWMIIGGIGFILFFGNMWINRNQEIKKDELISIEGTIGNKLEVKRKKSVGSSMIIRLNEYPKIDYKIGRFSISGLNLGSLQNNVKVGDKIQADVMQDEYSQIVPNKQRTISVYGLRDDNEEYLNLNSHNSAKKKDRNSISMYLILGFSFWMLGYGIYLTIKNKKKPTANKG